MTRRERITYALIAVGWIAYGLYFLAAGHLTTSDKVVAFASIAGGALCLVAIAFEALVASTRNSNT